MSRCVARYSMAWWLRCGAVFVAVTVPVMAPAQMQPQDQAMQQRLDRIERDLNMLQRQVYRGAPSAPAAGGAPGGSSTAADLEVRMEQVEAQMRELTGKVEQISNDVEQLKQRIEQINADFSVRFDQQSGGATASSAPPQRSSGDGGRGAGGPPGTVVPPPSGGGLNPVFGTLSPPGTGPSRSSGGAEPASTEPQGGGTTTEQFNHAFGLLKQSDYPGAEAALKAFIDAHPNDPLAGNAQYWLGQTFFARNKFSEAATAFAEGYKRFPKGAKAEDDLLYLGLSLARADQKKNACLALGQLDQSFPNGSPAIRQRAAAEKKRLGCA